MTKQTTGTSYPITYDEPGDPPDGAAMSKRMAEQISAYLDALSNRSVDHITGLSAKFSQNVEAFGVISVGMSAYKMTLNQDEFTAGNGSGGIDNHDVINWIKLQKYDLLLKAWMRENTITFRIKVTAPTQHSTAASGDKRYFGGTYEYRLSVATEGGVFGSFIPGITVATMHGRTWQTDDLLVPPYPPQGSADPAPVTPNPGVNLNWRFTTPALKNVACEVGTWQPPQMYPGYNTGQPVPTDYKIASLLVKFPPITVLNTPVYVEHDWQPGVDYYVDIICFRDGITQMFPIDNLGSASAQ
jgi:hypothetical protein